MIATILRSLEKTGRRFATHSNQETRAAGRTWTSCHPQHRPPGADQESKPITDLTAPELIDAILRCLAATRASFKKTTPPSRGDHVQHETQTERRSPEEAADLKSGYGAHHRC
jgi:hypothetical protein